jgi:CRP/FNR family transcriptional regulator, cyclic AMP receptor protein
MPQSRVELLQGMPVFGGISQDALEFLLRLASTVSIAKGSFFFREGDAATSMYVLERGRVVILKAREGRDHLLGHLVQGDCFGEMSLIDLYPRSTSVRAEEACTAIEISSDALFALYKRDLEQFTLIQMNIAREISRRLREADQRLFELQALKPRDPNPFFPYE